MSPFQDNTLQEEIRAARNTQNHHLDALRSGLPEINWDEIPGLLTEFRAEKEALQLRHDALEDPTSITDDFPSGWREFHQISSTKNNPDVVVKTLPLHHKLSDLLDRVIVEGVRTDKGLIMAIYKERLDEIEFRGEKLVKPIVNAVINVGFLSKPDSLIEKLIRGQAGQTIIERAEVCESILQRMLKLREAQATVDG